MGTSKTLFAVIAISIFCLLLAFLGQPKEEHWAAKTPANKKANIKETGIIRGIVKDQMAAVILNTKITIKSVDGSSEWSDYNSYNDGTFEFKDLSPGIYEIAFKAKDFQLNVVKQVLVKANETTTVNAMLSLANNSELIEVKDKLTLRKD